MQERTISVLVSIAGVAALVAGCGGGGSGAAAEPPPAVSDDPAVIGRFGPVFDWPVIPIHMAMLPDGRVMGFGSTPEGRQGSQMNYAVWDPAAGTGADSMLLLPNATGTDIMCAGQALLPATGELLIVGGDRTVNGVRNHANDNVNVFAPTGNVLTRQAQSMSFRRWYATVVTDAFGEQVVLGGMVDRISDPDLGVPGNVIPASVPEVYRSGSGWRRLDGAASEAAFAAANEGWYYPRAWPTADGRIFMLSHDGPLYEISTQGGGRIDTLQAVAPRSDSTLPSLMFEPGRILSLRSDRRAVVVDIRTPGKVAVQSTSQPHWYRRYGNTTVLADGKVWANGGSSTGNDLAGAVYRSETWDPATGQWTQAAQARMARLYHSAALLLPDGTVLTGGGGAPGPVRNLNAEIYHPPYLFLKDGSGRWATRPVIVEAPTVLERRQAFELRLDTAGVVSRITLVGAGHATHSFNGAQQFIELPFTQRGEQVRIQAPASHSAVLPGFYLLFVFDLHGVPSKARIVRLW